MVKRSLYGCAAALILAGCAATPPRDYSVSPPAYQNQRAYDENTVLAVARAYQSLTDWHTMHPPALVPKT